ncbi:MAG: 6-phosphogluconolactonase [Chthoniobacter sp.]
MISRILHSHDFAGDAARFILDHARKAIAERGLFRLGLTGGRSPRAIHTALMELAGDLPWKKIQLTFGDERCVPPDHEDSNYRVARETLIDPSGIPEGNVFRMRGEIDPETAAREYEAMLHAFAARLGEARYIHDLLLLGPRRRWPYRLALPRLARAGGNDARSPARDRHQAAAPAPYHDPPPDQRLAAHPLSRAPAGKTGNRRSLHRRRHPLPPRPASTARSGRPGSSAPSRRRPPHNRAGGAPPPRRHPELAKDL